MKEKRKLNIKGAILDKNQLDLYLEKIASDHTLRKNSSKDTYPIPRFNEDFYIIKEVYKLLNLHVELGIPIHPAGEWVLDNLYIIEEAVKSISKELTLKKYTNFLGLANGRYEGFARIYVLASEMVAYTDGKINSDNLKEMLQAYQNKKNLSMDEIWNIGLFIQIVLIENIREICEHIYSSQLQKYKVETIFSKFFENNNFKQVQMYKINAIKNRGFKSSFIEYMSYKLKKYGRQAYAYLNILEEEVNKTGANIADIIKREHFDIAVKKVSIGNAIITLKGMSRIDFLDIFEKINGVEDILRKDPANQYEKMDVDTKIYYRNAIQEIAKKTKVSEIYIAKKCLELSNTAKEKYEKNEAQNIKSTHIGYYLIDNGKNELLSILLNKKINKTTNREKANGYIGAIWGASIILCLTLCSNFYAFMNKNLIFSILLFIVAIIPIQNILSKVIQYILSKTVKPKLIPKLDFQNGIPEEFATMVVVPTIVKNSEKVKELMRKLEVYYIANKSENLYFTLLGDCTSSKKETEDFDEEVIKARNPNNK